MDKKFVQDIIPTKRRSRPAPVSRHLDVEEDEPIERVPMKRIHRGDLPQSSTRSKIRLPWKFSGILVTFCVIFIGVGIIMAALSLLYSKASVTITPKKAIFSITDTTFTAKKDMAASGTTSASSITTGLMYEVLTVNASDSQTASATDGPLIQTKAKGIVTLYNEQKVPQKIIAGTRLSNNDGLVYRTATTVTIPAGKTTGAGNITVGVIADQSGANYNMSFDKDEVFKVIAYKGQSKYTTVYGKMKAIIDGGYSGSKKIISPQVQADAIKTLKNNVKAKLTEQLEPLIPKGYVMYDGAYTIEYETLDPVSSDTGDAIITVKGALYGVIFRKDTLLKSVAKRELDKVTSPTYDVRGVEDLTFTILNSKEFSAKKGNSLVFTLKGPVTVVSTLSHDALKAELKGTYLKDSNAVFAHYPAIANAYALITPFWMRSFPNDPNKIIIEIKEP